MTDDARPAPFPRPLSLLPKALLEPRSPARAIAVGWVTAIIPSLALSALVAAAVPSGGRPEIDVNGLLTFAMLVVFAPISETLIMAGVLSVLLRIVSPSVAVIASAIGWGAAHSWLAPVWGLVVWWPFLVFSTLYVVWRERSLIAALAIPASVHALQNLGPAILLARGAAG